VERLLARLELKYGKYAIAHLTNVIVGGMAIVFVLSLARPEFQRALELDLGQVRNGQVWRLVTYVFLPTSNNIIWILFSLWWVWRVGTSLESEWGALKFNLYYLLGMTGTTAAAWLAGGAVGNSWLNMSLFFAFATVFPNYEIYPFPFIPLTIRVKWLALFAGAWALFRVLVGDWIDRGAILAALGNYFLFFHDHLWGLLRSRNLEVRQAARRTSMRPTPAPPTGGRVCAICGQQENDGADIRVCSCEKCGGPRNLCLEHARNH